MMDLTRKENKILLVDDEPDITIVFKLALEDAGFIVDTYQDPSVTLSKFKPNSYGLVITNIFISDWYISKGIEIYHRWMKS